MALVMGTESEEAFRESLGGSLGLRLGLGALRSLEPPSWVLVGRMEAIDGLQVGSARGGVVDGSAGVVSSSSSTSTSFRLRFRTT